MPARLHAPVRHDQRTADADPFAVLPEQADGAELELDPGDVADEGHGNERWLYHEPAEIAAAGRFWSLRPPLGECVERPI
jgi:hypothetical protein